MLSGPINLTGSWDGAFVYPEGLGPLTPFRAAIRHGANSFTGTIAEPHLGMSAVEVEATIVGYSDGVSVDFTKTYRRATGDYDNPVDYVGQLSHDGNRITGVWSLLDWNGRFVMNRRPLVNEVVRKTAGAEA